MNELELT